MDTPSQYAARTLAAVRTKRPLVHSISNPVSLNTVANALLAAGGSPVMAAAPEEVEEIVGHADALVLNIGALTEHRRQAMRIAGRQAYNRGIPIALDPVGVGASAMRIRTVQEILAQTPVSVVRGNPSEILALRHKEVRPAGVDAVHSPGQARKAAEELAAEYRITVAATGASDLVTDGRRTLTVGNGHPLLTKITGTGCTATAMVGLFLAVAPDPLRSAAAALAFFGLAAESAGRRADAPGSFWIRLLDALYTLTPEQLADGCRIAGAESTVDPWT